MSSGDADFILIVTARDMQEYEAFARQLFIENPCVRRFHTSIVVSRVKSGMMIPLDSD